MKGITTATSYPGNGKLMQQQAHWQQVACPLQWTLIHELVTRTLHQKRKPLPYPIFRG